MVEGKLKNLSPLFFTRTKFLDCVNSIKNQDGNTKEKKKKFVSTTHLETDLS